MNQKRSINLWQMIILLISSQLGSAIMYVPDALISIAKNNSWLSVLIAGGLSFVLLAINLSLYQKYPHLTLIELSRHCFGKALSLFLSIPFVIILLLMLCLILIDIKNFFTSSTMTQTPDYIFYSIILLNVVLTARAGLEIMARMFALFLMIMYGSTILILLLAIPFYQPENLLPFLTDGWKPIAHGVYFLVFPFGELFLIGMLLPFLKRSSRATLNKRLYQIHLFNTITLVIVITVTIMVLGPMAGQRSYSLFQMARLIEIGDFIERLESIIGLSITLGTFMKAVIVMFMLNLALSQLLKITDQRVLIFPLALLVFLLSSTIFHNEAEQTRTVQEIWPYLVIIGGIIPTLLIALVARFRKDGKNK